MLEATTGAGSMVEDLDPGQLGPLCSLGDDTRRRLYEYVVAAGEPVTRDMAGAALDLDRSLVAYHLDKLADEGLLTVSFARPDGRGGPGAGRPAKHYQRADVEVAVSIPPRDYQLAAELLARAVEADDSGGLQTAVAEVARQMGQDHAHGEPADDLMGVLRRQGYEPYVDDGRIRLRNCPFHQLARDHTDLVCHMNLAMLEGLASRVDRQVEARLDPAPGRCCVALVDPNE